jgi:uncharacterized membrane protein YfcA
MQTPPRPNVPLWLSILTVMVPGVLIAAYGAAWVVGQPLAELVARMWYLPGIGVFGAIIANTSGTGGGVVFVPVFNILRHEGILSLTREEVVGASFCIQCFGMTMGALMWTRNLYRDRTAPQAGVPQGQFWGIIGLVSALSIPAMLLTQRLVEVDARTVLFWFKGFSITLGLALILTTWTVNRTIPARQSLAPLDWVVLGLMAGPGGFITALFSVGIGEFVALYLFIRHYPLNTCTASAVIISAVHVQFGVIHNLEQGLVPWEVVVLAAPGAALGGFLARPIAHWLGAQRLKTLDGGWIVLSSVYLILLNV